MPFLDASALESDPEGLSFLRAVLNADPVRRRAWLTLPTPGEPSPLIVDTTVEILIEAAEQQSIVPAAPARA